MQNGVNKKAVISVENLTRYYGKTVGVKDISFEVHSGEIFGFLGSNGAGKTTTIRLLLDLLKPDGGTISIFGKETKFNSLEIRRQIGYLPGNFPMFGHLSGYEFIQFLSGLRGSQTGNFSVLANRFKLSPEILRRKTRHYSHGMLQKLGIIQAIMHNPQLLILDEPTLGLDPLMQEEFYQLLQEHRQRGATILFSSHRMDEVEKLCTRVAIIREGEITGQESIEVLKKKVGSVLDITLRQASDGIELPGAQLLKQQGMRWIFKITGEVHPLLKALSDLPVADITIGKPDLETVFMDFYRKNKNE